MSPSRVTTPLKGHFFLLQKERPYKRGLQGFHLKPVVAEIRTINNTIKEF
jgi:hypothetical protein